MEAAVGVGAPVGVKGLESRAGQGIAGVQRGQFEIATNDVVHGGEDFGVGVNAVENLALVAEIGKAPGALFLVDLDTRASTLLFAQLFEADSQRFQPFDIDEVGQDGVTFFVEVGFVCHRQRVLAGAKGFQRLSDIHAGVPRIDTHPSKRRRDQWISMAASVPA